MIAKLKKVSLTTDAIVTQAYAELTEDFNPIHLDPAFAACTPLRQCIVHGTMTLGLVWQALYRTFGPDALERVELDVRFIKPVVVGERVHAGGEEQADQPGRYSVWVKGDDGAERIVGTATFRNNRAG
ncbi:maoC like domain protein [Paraburkholderia xenovorans LB400]|uniref:Dehydratase n=1 Tax=Paraburkholderia xenovorans (strain LB400) TaxID=266265 RepID=Q13GQ2_PARXL|nr:MaoC family dehydratase [Paraburkholderia xenovorans]ABE36737.1 Putative dehydratase [Paraburkholderia xenovorans LB400]AIP34202.1 maoC like domain protein [Paraburkholderia xenovorans LB400]